MANNPEKNQQDTNSREAWQLEDAKGEEVSIPAIRHVGPTLESDPKYLGIADTGGQTPEQLIAEGIGTDDSNLRDIVSRGTEMEPRARQEGALRPEEPLKTRLPGDTSSDPHTDVGPDNATTLQNEPDIKRDAA